MEEIPELPAVVNHRIASYKPMGPVHFAPTKSCALYCSGFCYLKCTEDFRMVEGVRAESKYSF